MRKQHTPARRGLWGLALAGAAWCLAGSAHAHGSPTVEQILRFEPRQAGVDISTPKPDEQAGCKVGGPDGMVVTGSNCFKAGIEAIKAGTLYGTATEDPGTIAEQTADYVARYFNGEEPPATGTAGYL